ncbi:MAG: hypothetical protein V4450_11340 [Bacteroidota bacterium]
MKKFYSFSSTLLLSAVVSVLLLSCQKEQAAATDDTATPALENRVVGVQGGGPYSGSINPSYAASLGANYAKKYGSGDDQTQLVAFSAKDLVSFINGLKAKYKSDTIYVNFGIYGKGALPANSKDYGRLTVFFTGNRIPAPSTRVGNNGLLDDVLDEFLNHGGLVP